MAALSYYSNWDSFSHWDSSDVAIDDPELQSLHDAWSADYSVDLNDLFFPPQTQTETETETNSSLLPYDFNVNNGTPFHSLNSFHQEFEPFNFNYPKRHKLCSSEELYSSYFDPCLTMLQDYALPEIMAPPPQFPEFPVAEFSMGKDEEASGGGGGGGGLSAQSMAARQRRRRITDKTRELGKLIPGGQKMNTAEMLHSAHRYIKFMQAQLSLLQCINASPPPPPQEVALTFEAEEEFQKLLESPLIQEKLYTTEHCLLPRKFVEHLATHHKSNPHLLPILEKDD